MAALPDQSIGMVFSDPPWATPTRADVGRANGGSSLRADHEEWTADFDFPAYVKECARVLVEDGYALIWCGWHNILHILDAANLAFGFGANNVIARDTVNPAGRVRGLRVLPDGRKVGGGLVSSWDCIAVLHRPDTGSARCSLEGYHAHRNVRQASNPRAGRGQEGLTHPAKKPIALARELIRQFSLPGDTVLDTCCGGGNLLIAAALEGRTPIGCDKGKRELDGKPWAEIAAEAIARELREGT